MAASESAHALLSASALTAISQLLAPSFPASFEIPVTVLQQPLSEHGHANPGAARVVVMDKPLLRRTLTLREQHELLYKHAMIGLGNRAVCEVSASHLVTALQQGTDA